MTRQEVLDRVWRHFIHGNGRPSWLPQPVGPRYRTGDGRRCPIGMLIPDRVYRPWMEGKPVRTLLRQSEWLEMRLAPIGKQFLSELQEAHDLAAYHSGDRPAFRQEFARRLRDLAESHRLSVPGE